MSQIEENKERSGSPPQRQVLARGPLEDSLAPVKIGAGYGT